MCQYTWGGGDAIGAPDISPGSYVPPDSGFCSQSLTASASRGCCCLGIMILSAQQQQCPGICVSCKRHSYRTFNALI